MSALLVAAGFAQLALALASLAIPRVLGWRRETATLTPLTRAVFWTYAGYIWGINVCLGLVSTLAPAALLDGSTLARAVCAFIALYWGARVAIQLLWFHRLAPTGGRFAVAEAAMLLLFGSLTVLYGALALGAL